MPISDLLLIYKTSIDCLPLALTESKGIVKAAYSENISTLKTINVRKMILSQKKPPLQNMIDCA